jgi:nucleoside-diphosphate-sugar epimerase
MLTGKRILLTGFTGQVAGAFGDQLAPHNEVWGLARFTQPGSLEKAEKAGVKPVVGDYTKGEFDGIPTDLDCVIHVAAAVRPGKAEVGMVANAEGTGLLMHHFRQAKAFIYASATGCYAAHPDPMHRYLETDDLGGQTLFAPNYGVTKAAAEGVVRTLSRIHNIPAVIARVNVSYGGPYDDGGLPGGLLEKVLSRTPIQLPKDYPFMCSPIHDEDMSRHLEQFVAAASVPALVVNWGGPDAVSLREMAEYLGELVGIAPVFEVADGAFPLPACIVDTTLSRKIGMEWQIPWKEGFRRMVRARHPEIALAA